MKSIPRSKYKGQNSPYKLNNGKYSDGSDDDIDLPIRKVYKPQHFIEAQINDGDTLQAIALRFNCTTTTIMRANNILRENEIFAKRVLKIPVTAYSLLTESLPLVHTSGNSSPTRNTEPKPVQNQSESILLDSDDQFQQKLIIASVNASEIKHPKYSSSSFEGNNFPSTSKDLSGVASSSLEHLTNVSNSVDFQDPGAPLLVNKERRETVESVMINEFTSRGADFGIKWFHLLICILLLAFIGPLIYVLYVAEHPEKYHHYNEHH